MFIGGGGGGGYRQAGKISLVVGGFCSNIQPVQACLDSSSRFPCVVIRESVDSLCRDDADMPMPPYIRKACNRPNAAFVSLFMYLTVIYGCFST